MKGFISQNWFVIALIAIVGSGITMRHQQSNPSLDGVNFLTAAAPTFESPKEAETPHVALYAWQNVPENDREKFIQRFNRVAQAEMRKFEIPASIVLAQGLYQSGAGKSYASKKGKNYFNLAAPDTWNGPTGLYGRVSLKHYDTAWLSFRDHSLFVSDPSFLKSKPASNDFKSWARSLQQAGYNTDPALAEMLVKIILQYDLAKYDDLP